MSTKLDASQVIRASFDEETNSLITKISNTFISVSYDGIELEYINGGNGDGKVGVVTYTLAGNTQATVTLNYDASNRLISVYRS